MFKLFSKVGKKKSQSKRNRVLDVESLDRRELMAADLVGSHFNVDSTAQWGGTLSVDAVVSNIGNDVARASNASVYLSSNSYVSTFDHFLGNIRIDPLMPGGTDTINNRSIRLPSSPPSGFTSNDNVFIGIIVDSDRRNSEGQGERNNSNRGLGRDKDRLTIRQTSTPTTSDNDINDQMSEAMNLGRLTRQVRRTGDIDSATDVDLFRLSVRAGQTLRFDIDGRSFVFDSYLRLFDSSGRQIAANNNRAAPGEHRSLESYIEHRFTRSGTYYVGVSGNGNSSYSPISGRFDSNGRRGSYELIVSPVQDAAPPVVTPPVVAPPTIDPPTVERFDSEPNNNRGRADFIRTFNRGFHSKTFYGSTGHGTDREDWFRIRLNGRTSGTISLSGMFQDLDLQLRDSSGRVIRRSINGGTRTDTIRVNSLAAGDYYVRVYKGTTSARSAYALRFGLTVR